MSEENITVIGRVEHVEIPMLDAKDVHAKVDTGADVSSIWASHVVETPKGLECIFFGKGSPYYNGQVHIFPVSSYSITRVSSSFGQRQVRYKIKLKIILVNRKINATFTLADRGNKLYPVLLGRKLLKSKFLVDVSSGKPLIEEEKARKIKLKKELPSLRSKNS